MSFFAIQPDVDHYPALLGAMHRCHAIGLSIRFAASSTWEMLVILRTVLLRYALALSRGNLHVHYLQFHRKLIELLL